MTAMLLVGLKLSVAALILAIGLSSTWADLTYLWRRPWQLLRALFAMYVAIPVTAFFVLKALPLPRAVEVAILVLAVSAGAPLLPRKLMKVGHDSYMLSLVATSSIVAVVAVPLWLDVLKPVYGLSVELTALNVAGVIAGSFVGPLIVGMLVRWRFPETGARLGDRFLTIASIALALFALLLLVLHGRTLLELGWPSLVALVALTFAALGIGHLLGGPAENDRTALAIACATRHVGIAMVVASTVPGPRTAVLVTAYVLAAALVSFPYLKARTRTPA
ncbi:hypothetical protein DLJ53_09520 [Acuticoccus sediminis]|uniref:Na+-dependent transporter n=1 Tax=Acuticoccus sediminis TaxID=2184697 RepID=A0A8B2NVU4_9HYPH|nr:hypothetical protein [Acuticoccus sediminis]RAI01644.1 hypothetical protein DLJ53_09520 [Acuticoccus sediminis]